MIRPVIILALIVAALAVWLWWLWSDPEVTTFYGDDEPTRDPRPDGLLR